MTKKTRASKVRTRIASTKTGMAPAREKLVCNLALDIHAVGESVDR